MAGRSGECLKCLRLRPWVLCALCFILGVGSFYLFMRFQPWWSVVDSDALRQFVVRYNQMVLQCMGQGQQPEAFKFRRVDE